MRLKTTNKLHRIAVFASGAGSNAAQIFTHFAAHKTIEVALLVCNKADAPVLGIAERHDIETFLIDRKMWQTPTEILEKLQISGVSFVVLAGFLWHVPAALVAAYPLRMTNLHPALLPKFGGQGMYGMNVHQAVLAAHETESGITIHYVNENYDEGAHIAQFSCPVLPTDTPEILSHRIRKLELAHYAPVIEQLLTQL
jgi:phosphoribosylglycinamide formyltransferase 1